MLIDPLFVPGPAEAAFLAECTRREVIEKRSPTEAEKQERRRVSCRIGEMATLELLSGLGSAWSVTDANSLVTNQFGYDVMVARKSSPGNTLHIQAKGTSYLEMIQFKMPSSPVARAWKFDILLLVDAGITLDRLGRFPQVKAPRQPHVGFYVFTRGEVLEELAHARRKETDGSVYIYRWWAPRKPGSLEDRHQIPNLERYRNRFDVIEDALARIGPLV